MITQPYLKAKGEKNVGESWKIITVNLKLYAYSELLKLPYDVCRESAVWVNTSHLNRTQLGHAPTPNLSGTIDSPDDPIIP